MMSNENKITLIMKCNNLPTLQFRFLKRREIFSFRNIRMKLVNAKMLINYAVRTGSKCEKKVDDYRKVEQEKCAKKDEIRQG